MPLECVGRLRQVIGITEDLIAQTEEDDRRNLRVVTQHVVERRINLRRAETLVVLKTRNDEQRKPSSQLDLIGWDAQRHCVEVIDLGVHLDQPRSRRAQNAHALGHEVERELAAITMVGRGIRNEQIDGTVHNAVVTNQPGQERVADRRNAGLVHQRGARRR